MALGRTRRSIELRGCPEIETGARRPVGTPRGRQDDARPPREFSGQRGARAARHDRGRVDHLRIVDRSGGWSAVPDAGYRIAYAVTADFLNAGHDVVADSVNPLAVTRQAWADTARAADALLIDVEVICSDREVHRNRVETRSPDIDGLTVPTWQQVEDRAYEPWSTRVLRVDTATGIDQAADVIVATFISSQATIVG